MTVIIASYEKIHLDLCFRPYGKINCKCIKCEKKKPCKIEENKSEYLLNLKFKPLWQQNNEENY